jgi:hypothetical protein
VRGIPISELNWHLTDRIPFFVGIILLNARPEFGVFMQMRRHHVHVSIISSFVYWRDMVAGVFGLLDSAHLA